MDDTPDDLLEITELVERLEHKIEELEEQIKHLEQSEKAADREIERLNSIINRTQEGLKKLIEIC